MEIYFDKEDKTYKIDFVGEKSVKEILKELNISFSSVIVEYNESLILEDKMLNNSDKINLLSVVSGG